MRAIIATRIDKTTPKVVLSLTALLHSSPSHAQTSCLPPKPDR